MKGKLGIKERRSGGRGIRGNGRGQWRDGNRRYLVHECEGEDFECEGEPAFEVNSVASEDPNVEPQVQNLDVELLVGNCNPKSQEIDMAVPSF